MALIEAIASRFLGPRLAGTTAARLSGIGSLAVSQVEPPGLDMTRAGKRFRLAPLAGATGIAPVQTIPTTAAQWTLFNTSTTKSMIIETAGLAVHSGTTGVGGQCLAALFSTPAQTGFATGMAVANMLPSSTNTSAAAVKSGVTVTLPAAPAWFSIAETFSPNVGAYPGSGLLINRAVNGKIIVPPLYGLALAALALAGTTPLYIPVLEWCELELDNE